MSAITAKASRKMKKYAVLTREPRCFLGSFDFSWEQRKLSEIADKVTEKNAGLQYVETFTNSAEFGIISQRDFFDHDIAKLGSLDGYYIVKNEDFVYNPRISTSAPVGPINRNKLGRTGVMSPLYTVFRPHDVDTTYLEHFFKCAYWHSFMNFNGDSGARSDRFSIKDDVFFQMPIPLPYIDEQRKIGELLTRLDHLITLHQRKCVFLFGFFQAFISMIFTASTFSWEQRKLGDIADIVGGGTPSTGNQSYWDGDIDWYAPAEIADQIYANSSQKKITGLGYENSSAKMLPPGTVLFTSRAGIGKTAIVTRKGCTNQGFQSIVPHRGELDSYFIFSRTEELKRYGELVGAGSTFVEVSGKQMAVMELMMPPTMREQQTIGGFFQQLDHLITLHQRECISFTARAGRRILTANKKRNTSSWEQRKLGEIGSVSMCRRIFKEQTSETGDIPFYKIGTFGADPDAFISRELFEEYKSKYPYPPKGDILISASGSIGRAVEFAGNNEYFQDSNIVWLNHDERLSNPFLKCFYSVVKWAGIEGSTIKRLYNDNILNTVICMPSVPEQKRIGLFFENLDNLITLHQRKPFLMKWRTSDANRNQTNRLVL